MITTDHTTTLHLDSAASTWLAIALEERATYLEEHRPSAVASLAELNAEAGVCSAIVAALSDDCPPLTITIHRTQPHLSAIEDAS